VLRRVPAVAAGARGPPAPGLKRLGDTAFVEWQASFSAMYRSPRRPSILPERLLKAADEPRSFHGGRPLIDAWTSLKSFKKKQGSLR